MLAKLHDGPVDLQFFDEHPLSSSGLLTRLALKLAPEALVCRLLMRRLKSLDLANLDGLTLIRARYMDQSTLAYVLDRVPAERISLYVWDSRDNLPYLADQIAALPAVTSFDPVDARHFDIPYLPLYLPDPQVTTDFADCPADIGYYGTYYGQRLDALALVENHAAQAGLSCDNRLFLSRFQYLRTCLRRPWRRAMMKSHSCQHPARPLDVLDRARVIFDFCEPEQNGVSFRLLEAIANGRRIITNNRELEQVVGPTRDVVYFRDLQDLPDVLAGIPDVFYRTPPAWPELDHLRLEKWVRRLLP